jgi:hypothetical protein
MEEEVESWVFESTGWSVGQHEPDDPDFVVWPN